MIYDSTLVSLLKIKELDNYIPKMMSKDDYPKEFHKYISLTDRDCKEPFKIESSFVEDGIRYYCVKYLKSIRFAVLPEPLHLTYEFIKDRNNIKKKNIINDNEYYYGSEIRYWFYINKIDLDSTRYLAFRKYVEPYRSNSIIDSVLYKVEGFLTEDKERYSNCRFIRQQERR